MVNRACSEGPVGRESQTRKVQIKEREQPAEKQEADDHFGSESL